MTNKLKCPFCQTELDYDEYGWDYSCSNHSCQKSLGILSGTEKLWQAMIQSQKDLEESQQATLQNAQTVLEIHKDLEVARKALESISGIRRNIEDYYGGVSIHYQQMVLHMDEIATNALKQIEHKE